MGDRGCCCSPAPDKKEETCCKKEEISCCGAVKNIEYWISGYIDTETGKIPVIKTELSGFDILSSVKMRFGIGRNGYKVNPGLYASGSPDKDSPVIVTANYKMTFDFVRKELKDGNFWILVLDTKGINVWCAAGKGSFGTEELVKRIELTGLSKIVSHRNLLVPQLGAPGISAHEVKKRSGFKVIYGPVYIKDLNEFIASDMKATSEMRRVKFGIVDRLCMTPVELTGSLKITVIALIISFLMGVIMKKGFHGFYYGGQIFLLYLTALFSGSVVTPLLLPWIPGRAFFVKGIITGAIISLLLLKFTHMISFPWLFIITGISSFYAMNFTGASTYTSLSGVKKEMKLALPVQILLFITGFVFFIIGGV